MNGEHHSGSDPRPEIPGTAPPATSAQGRQGWLSPAERGRKSSARPRIVLQALLGAAAVATLALVVATRWVGADAAHLDLEVAGRVAVLPWVNATGDPGDGWVGYGLAEMLSSALSRTRGVGVIDSERFFRAIGERRLDVDDPAVRSRLRELAFALGADAAVDLTLRKRGSSADREVRYTAELRLVDRAGATTRGELHGADALQAADRVARSIALGRVSGEVPVQMAAAFSRDAFVDRLYGMGLHKLRSSGCDEAEAYFEIALESRPSFLQPKARLAECARQSGDAERSRELVLAVLEDAQARGDRRYQVWSFQSLARLAAAAGRFAEAEEHASRAFSLVLGTDDPMARADLLFERARLALAGGETRRAEDLFVEVLQLRQTLGDRLGEADALVEIGSLFRNGGDLDGARDALRQARRISENLEDVWTEMRVVASLGDVARRQGQLAEARELWQQALGFYTLQHDREHELLVSRNLADVLVALEDLETAEDLLHQVIDLAAELGRPEIEARASLRLTWVLLRKGYPLQARTHLDRTLALDRHLDDERHYLQVIIGWFAYEQGKYELAVKTLREAKRQSGQKWPAWSQEYLRIFEEALIVGRRLPLPGEDGYSAAG